MILLLIQTACDEWGGSSQLKQNLQVLLVPAPLPRRLLARKKLFKKCQNERSIIWKVCLKLNSFLYWLTPGINDQLWQDTCSLFFFFFSLFSFYFTVGLSLICGYCANRALHGRQVHLCWSSNMKFLCSLTAPSTHPAKKKRKIKWKKNQNNLLVS